MLNDSNESLNRHSLGISDDDIALWSSPKKLIKYVHADKKIGHNQLFLNELNFYLASINQRVWIPRVAIVSAKDSIRGFVFAKEMKIKGIRTRLLFIDMTNGRSTVMAESSESDHVLRAALGFILDTKQFRGLLITVNPNGPELRVLVELSRGRPFKLSLYPGFRFHDRLELPDTFEEFKQRLPKGTRKTLVNRSNKVEGLGIKFYPEVNAEEFARAAVAITRKYRVFNNLSRIKRNLGMLANSEYPIRSGLQDQKGNWLSLIAGWHKEDSAWIVSQINCDREYPELSLSFVLRGHLIKHLIDKHKTPSLSFWAGCGGLLSGRCHSVPASLLHVDSTSILWQTTQKLALRILPFLLGSPSRAALSGVLGALGPDFWHDYRRNHQ